MCFVRELSPSAKPWIRLNRRPMKHIRNKLYKLVQYPEVTAGVYILLGCLWIVLSSSLLEWSVNDPVTLHTLALTTSLIFVVVTGGLLYFILKSKSYTNTTRAKPGTESDDSDHHQPATRPLLVTLIAMFLLVPLVAYLIIYYEIPHNEQQTFDNLQSIVQLKAEQIQNWHDERQADGLSLARDPQFIKQIRSLPGNPTARDALQARLTAFREAYNYPSVALFGPHPEHKLLIQSGQTRTMDLQHIPLDKHSNNSGVMTGMTTVFHGNSGELHLDFIIPVFSSPQPDMQAVGFILLRTAPDQFLFPYIKRWPYSTKSGENLIVREHDGKIQFINKTRFADKDALEFDQPLETTDLPAAVALREKSSGTVSGKDYRNVPVLAAYQPVPGTDWHLIAKIDKAEINKPVYILVRWVVITTLIVLGVIVASLLLVWRQQQRLNQLQVQTERQNADNLLTMFYELPFIGIAFTSAETKRWLRFNHSLCEILGYPEEELAEKNWTDLTHPDDIDNDVAQFERVMRNEIDGYHMDKRFIRKDGSVIYAYIDVKCVRKPDGEVDYFIAMVQDINERKLGELALERAQQQAQHYLDIAGVMMIALDDNGCIKMANQRACEILGYEEQELLGKNWFEHFIPEPERQDITSVFKQLMTGEIEPVKFYENHVQTRDGEHRLIAWHNSSLCDHDKIIGILSSGEDITDARAAQEDLKNNRARLHTLLQSIPDLIWVKDNEERYLMCNAMFERFIGHTEAEIIGRQDTELIGKKLANLAHQFDKKVLESEGMIKYEVDLTFKSDGYQGRFEISKRLMFNNEGKVIGILGIAHDITQRENDTRQITQLSQLYATLSHTNQAIVRSKTEDELYNQVCHNAVEYERFNLAWIGLLNPENLAIEPVASYGEQAAAYLEELRLSADPNDASSHGPCGTALRTGNAYWSQDFLHEYPDAPWYESAKKAGLASAAALPLYRDGNIIGVFVLYADATNAFDEASRELLSEVATDISFALDNFESEKKRIKAEQRLELIIKGSNDAPWDWDLQNNKLYYSPQWWQMLGYEPDELPSDSDLWRRLSHPDDIGQVEQALHRIQQPGHTRERAECRLRHKDGHYVPTLIRGIVTRDESGVPIRLSGTSTDMTERVRTESQLRDQLDELNRWFNSTIDREERILELKKEINKLLKQRQQPPRYPSADESPNEEMTK